MVRPGDTDDDHADVRVAVDGPVPVPATEAVPIDELGRGLLELEAPERSPRDDGRDRPRPEHYAQEKGHERRHADPEPSVAYRGTDRLPRTLGDGPPRTHRAEPEVDASYVLPERGEGRRRCGRDRLAPGRRAPRDGQLLDVGRPAVAIGTHRDGEPHERGRSWAAAAFSSRSSGPRK